MAISQNAYSPNDYYTHWFTGSTHPFCVGRGSFSDPILCDSGSVCHRYWVEWWCVVYICEEDVKVIIFQQKANDCNDDSSSIQ
jgi:hypothetical protein